MYILVIFLDDFIAPISYGLPEEMFFSNISPIFRIFSHKLKKGFREILRAFIVLIHSWLNPTFRIKHNFLIDI